MGHHDRTNNSFAGVINIYCSLANGERFLDNTICKREGKWSYYQLTPIHYCP